MLLGRDASHVLGVRVAAARAAAGTEPPTRVEPIQPDGGPARDADRRRRVLDALDGWTLRRALRETARVHRPPVRHARERPHALVPRHRREPRAPHLARARPGVSAEFPGENLDRHRVCVKPSRGVRDDDLNLAVGGDLPTPRGHLERLALGAQPELKLERYGNLAGQFHRLGLRAAQRAESEVDVFGKLGLVGCRIRVHREDGVLVPTRAYAHAVVVVPQVVGAEIDADGVGHAGCERPFPFPTHREVLRGGLEDLQPLRLASGVCDREPAGVHLANLEAAEVHDVRFDREVSNLAGTRVDASQQSILRYLQVGLILRHERHVHRRRPDGRRLRHVRQDR
mmetsp:Transcript_5428/g.24145  ORF Transcript_5428/g.24145 Transcript_5428/m.24145 type:complete len:341 (+) Transcript_5428:384-1406(+)